MNDHEKINYVEFPAKDIEATKTFFTAVFLSFRGSAFQYLGISFPAGWRDAQRPI